MTITKEQTYLFHRLVEGNPYFYPVTLPANTTHQNILDHVACNPGTLKVTTPDGTVIWSLQ